MLRGAIHPRGRSADAQRVGNQVNVAPIRRVVVIDVARRSVALQLKGWSRLAIQVDRIPLVEVETKGIALRLPSHAVDLLGKESVSLRFVVPAQPKNAVRRSPGDGHDPRL